MTAEFLASQLTNLIQESKRKNVELRSAAEKALSDLKALRATSETQLASDLSRRPSFIRPFLIACGTPNGKATGIAILCLHRLVSLQALSKETLKDVLQALDEATPQNADVQLKILQTLPAMSQYYGDELRGDLIGTALLICSKLQGNKIGVIRSTAAATLQQLVVAVFDRIVIEDENTSNQAITEHASAPDGGNQVQAAAVDGYKILQDICFLSEGHKPQFLQVKIMTQTFGLELIEAILSDHWRIFLSHPEETEVLRTRIMPLVASVLTERSDFPSTVRAMRILNIVLRHHVEVIPAECENALHIMNRLLEADHGRSWKRALSMEVWNGIHAEPGLVQSLYARFDEQGGKKNIVREQLAALARMAAERPDIIGIGQQSTMPSTQVGAKDQSSEQVAMEAGGLAGMIGGVVTSDVTEALGISAQWSSVRVSCLDQLDKTDPPTLPDSYVYSLVVICINSFSDGLARLILPLTNPYNGRKPKRTKTVTAAEDEDSETPAPDSSRRRGTEAKQAAGKSLSRRATAPVNPLTLSGHQSYAEIKTAASIVEACWPAILATCSTFLYATLDHSFFHGLVRCIQKLTHVAGLLRLETPRDAFLTVLSKSAVPPHKIPLNSLQSSMAYAQRGEDRVLDTKGFWPALSPLVQAPTTPSEETREHVLTSIAPTLNARNLLCLRALLNLGIALGPVLGQAWSIILETWQQADFTLHASVRDMKRKHSEISPEFEGQFGNQGTVSHSDMESEISAVDAAASRLLESTADFTDDTFIDVLNAMGKLLASTAELVHSNENMPSPLSPRPSSSSSARSGHRIPSAYNAYISVLSQNQMIQFSLNTIAALTKINMMRLSEREPSASGWNVLVQQLIQLTCSPLGSSSIRLRSAEVLNTLVKEAAKSINAVSPELRSKILLRSLTTLHQEIDNLTSDPERSLSAVKVDTDVHRMALESLKTILEDCGEALVEGWSTVFQSIASIFKPESAARRETLQGELGPRLNLGFSSIARSSALIRPSFSSLQLICSDFLSSLPNPCILTLIDTLPMFCLQADDLNISLTSITLFWNISAFLQDRQGSEHFGSRVLTTDDEKSLLKDATSDNGANTTLSLWMILLLRLTEVTVDPRLEVRNGAVQSIFRIFDAYGDRLSVNTWGSCIRIVIFKLIRENIERQQTLDAPGGSGSNREMTSWDETITTIVDDVAGLFGSYIHVFLQHADFQDMWATLIRYFEEILSRRRHDLTVAIFKSLERILTTISKEHIEASSLHLVWILWLENTPVGVVATSNSNSNEDALVAYVQSFRAIYRLIKPDVTDERTVKILQCLLDCVVKLQAPMYAKDVEKLTQLQTVVFETVKSLHTDAPGTPSTLIRWISKLVTLPFDRNTLKADAKPLTFIAMASASLTLLQSTILEHVHLEEIYTHGAFHSALESLAKAITMHHLIRAETKNSTFRAVAITSSLKILASAIPVMKGLTIEEQDIRRIWGCIVDISHGILCADSGPTDTSADLSSEQDFDTDSFLTLRNLVTPTLGSSLILDETRFAYTESLFTNSLIHAPEPSDIPASRQEMFDGIYDIDLGRTYDPPASKRAKLAYVCLDELFSLVARHDGSPERRRLAQAASPFLVLRAVIILRRYIADQRLRGRMPQPLSQRRELLHILRKLMSLECEPSAIPNTPGAVSENRKHLHRVLPLVNKAMKMAWRDQVVLGELSRILELVSDEMGII